MYPYGRVSDAVQAPQDQQPDVIEDQDGSECEHAERPLWSYTGESVSKL